MKKTDLRKLAKDIRKNFDTNMLSEDLCRILRTKEYYKAAKNILIFYPLEYEIDLRCLLEDDKNFYLPRVDGENLLVCPFEEEDNLKKSAFNVLEPCSEPVSAEVINLAVIPALMTDITNQRLGYGGGFYDRFLAQNPNIISVVLISKKLVTECLPVEAFDVKVDDVICI